MSNKKTQKPTKKGRKPAHIDEYFAKMERYLILGYSLNMAAKLGGVPARTVYDYYNQNEKFRNRVDALVNAPNVKARAVWIQKINNNDYQAAKDWLERRERAEFATRQEQTGADGEPLPAMKVVFVDDDDQQ